MKIKTTKKIVIISFLLVASFFISSESAKAMSYTDTYFYGSNQYAKYTLSLNKTIYPTDGTASFYGTLDNSFLCGDAMTECFQTDVIVTINGVQKSFFIGSNDFYQRYPNISNDNAFTVQSTPGDYTAKVTFTHPSLVPTYAYIPYTVVAPVPTCSISWSPTSINVGGSSTITWSSTNATSRVASCTGPIPSPSTGDNVVNGSMSVSFSSAGTETCSMTVTGPGGSKFCSKSLVVNPAPCNLPWGGTIASGTSVTAYDASNVSYCNGACPSQNRTCTNGVLSGSYNRQTCGNCSCYVCSAGACAGKNDPAFCTNPSYSSLATCQSSCSAASTMSGTLTPATSTCTIASGASTCTKTLTWTTTNPVGTSAVTSNTGTPSPGTSANNSSQTFTVPYNNGSASTFYLYNNAVSLATATVTPSCVAGTSWDGTKCASCTPTTSFTGSISPSSVFTGGAYTLSCDYGVTSNAVFPSVGSGSCTWGGWTGTKANFNCTAGSVSGTFSNNCTINNNSTYPYCTRTNSVNSLTVKVMSGTLTASNCTIASGASSCNTNLAWTTTNPESTSAVTTPTNITVATGLSGSATYSVTGGSPNGTRTFYLYNNAKSLVPTSPNGSGVVATATCATGTTWDGTRCAVNPMSGTLTPATSSCVIASGASTCTVNLNWSITNPVGTPTAITASGMTNVNVTTTLATPQSGGPVALTVPWGGRTFYLYNNAVSLAQSVVSASSVTCASGSSWDDSRDMCVVNPIYVTLSAYPPSMTLPENSTTLTWTTTGTPSSCTASGDWSGPKTVGGSQNIAGLTAGEHTYTITCSKSGVNDVSSTATATVGVVVGSDGVCSTLHYNCSTGTPANKVSSPSKWTWICNGLDGGNPSPLCSEKKSPGYIED